MNRRSFLQAATASSTLAAVSGKYSIAASSPLDVDLANPAASKYLHTSAVSGFARMEELDPADPGEMSGAELRVGDAGAAVSLSARIGTHALGYVHGEQLARFVSRARKPKDETFGTLLTLDQTRSGAVLQYLPRPEPQIRLEMGFAHHCLGVLRGANLRRLMEWATVRSGVPLEA